MRARFVTVVTALISLFSGLLFNVDHALSADLSSPVGLWLAVDDDTKQPTGWFLITDDNGIYDGIIAKMYLKPGEDPNVVCDQCKDDRHDHPWLGLQIIRGMKPDVDAKYADGTILDPRDGKVYKATMKLTPDGQTLVVRGYLGFALLGKNQYWTRLPDSVYGTLDPSINPNPAVNSNGAPNSAPKRAPPHKSYLTPYSQNAAGH